MKRPLTAKSQPDILVQASRAMAALIAVLLVVAIVAVSAPKASAPADAVVKVLVDGGHGSGVHLGKGVVLTAAHVTTGKLDLKVKAKDEVVLDAVRLWENSEEDVALIYAPGLVAAAAPLECAPMTIGDEIRAVGNPGRIEFATMWGKVSALNQNVGPFKRIVISDMALAVGMSGGPVFDVAGAIRGIAVAILGAGMYGSASPISVVIPSNTLCLLMGK